MIVSVTRDDLRDEFSMADEAFALSPISARAAQPREEDYNAISEAFMETSRGRWFLGEYAKRNRNADTRMVLDAVARIEETIAAQKKPVADNGLAEALVAIKAALVEARAEATTALGDLALEENLAPARKGIRVIREIAWRLREIGADGRICDLIDSQLGAIEGACEKVAATDPGPALSAAFDLIEGRIKAFDNSEPSAPQPTENVVAFTPPTVGGAAPEQTAPKATPFVARVAEETIRSPAPAVAAEPMAPTAEAVESRTEVADPATADVASEVQDADVQDADAHDDAVLDMVAFEMAAPDPADADESPYNETYDIHASRETQASDETEASGAIEASRETRASDEAPAAAFSSGESIMVAERPEPVSAPNIQPAPAASIDPSPEPSLGSSLIASGILQGRASRSDPLAPIRRMSQAEKIAFFS